MLCGDGQDGGLTRQPELGRGLADASEEMLRLALHGALGAGLVRGAGRAARRVPLQPAAQPRVRVRVRVRAARAELQLTFSIVAIW